MQILILWRILIIFYSSFYKYHFIIMVNHVFNEMHFILTFMLQLKYIITNMLAIVMDYLFLILKRFYLLIFIMILMSFNIIYKDLHYLKDYY